MTRDKSKFHTNVGNPVVSRSIQNSTAQNILLSQKDKLSDEVPNIL